MQIGINVLAECSCPIQDFPKNRNSYLGVQRRSSARAVQKPALSQAAGCLGRKHFINLEPYAGTTR